MAKYIDNEHFHYVLTEYQNYSDNVEPWPYKFKIKKDKPWHPEFVKNKIKQLEERIIMLASETPQQKEIRNNKLIRVKNELGKLYIKITTHVLQQPNYSKYSIERKQDMQSEALYRMLIYADRFDLNQKNPFSYFTEFANRAYWSYINNHKINDLKFVSINYIDQIDEQD